jgi:peptidoglycan/LPS O-acetylase OafA/YrhL
VGVDLFFVLSGFLVSGLLFAESKASGCVDATRFLVRRGLKIYPAFFVLILTTLLVRLAGHREISIGSVISEVSFMQSYFPGLWNHTWSLSVEEHFYLLLLIALLVILRRGRGATNMLRAVLLIAVGIGAICLVLRWLAWQRNPEFSFYRHAFPSYLRLDSLFFGVAISAMYHYRSAWFWSRLNRFRVLMLGVGVLMFVPFFVVEIESTPWVSIWGFTMLYVASGMVIAGAILVTSGRAWRIVGLLGALGSFSYSIYLWHMPVHAWGNIAIDALGGDSVGYGVRMLAYFAGSLLIGVLLSKMIELPVVRMRDRLFPSRTYDALVARRVPSVPSERSGSSGS